MFMQPNQPQSPPPSYDFILNNQPQKSGPAFLRNQDPGRRRLLAIGFVASFVLLIIIVLVILFSGGNENSIAIKRVIAQQTEIVRVASEAQKETRDPAVRNRIATLLAYTSSDLQKLDTYARQNGVATSDQELASAKDVSIDEELETASQRGNYDSTAESILAEESETYQQLLTAARENSSSEPTIQLLDQLTTNTVTYND